MLWYRTDETITEDWRSESAYNLEAGKRPIFNLGHSNTTLDGILGLTALQKFIAGYQTLLQPLVAVGGHSALWLFALLQMSRPNIQTILESTTLPKHPISAQESTILFTGVDPVTQIAVVATHQSAERTRSAISPKRRWLGLRKSMRHIFAPTSEPSTITPVDGLPFTTSPIRVKHQIDDTPQLGNRASLHQRNRLEATQARVWEAAPSTSLATHEQTVWTARAAIGLAALLFLAALLI